ncbi:MAG: hypothetical protein WBC05_20465 [Sedimentisphaerales bacterium]
MHTSDEQRKAYRTLGRLCKLNVRTDKLTILLDDPKGTVRDPQVHYDSRKIVFLTEGVVRILSTCMKSIPTGLRCAN